MKRNAQRTFALAAMLTATGAHAQTAAAEQCVAAADVETVMLTFAPGAMRALRTGCQPMLAPGSYLGGAGGEAMVDRYEEAAALAKPASKEAMARAFKGKEAAFGNQDISPIIELMVGAAVEKLDAKTCNLISRGLELIDPLPPKNIAGLIIVALEADAGNKKSPPPLVICTATDK